MLKNVHESGWTYLSEEFIEDLERAIGGGQTVSSVLQQYGINRGTYYSWLAIGEGRMQRWRDGTPISEDMRTNCCVCSNGFCGRAKRPCAPSARPSARPGARLSRAQSSNRPAFRRCSQGGSSPEPTGAIAVAVAVTVAFAVDRHGGDGHRRTGAGASTTGMRSRGTMTGPLRPDDQVLQIVEQRIQRRRDEDRQQRRRQQPANHDDRHRRARLGARLQLERQRQHAEAHRAPWSS